MGVPGVMMRVVAGATVTGTAGAFVVTGTAGAFVVIGTAGADEVTGTTGADVVTGAPARGAAVAGPLAPDTATGGARAPETETGGAVAATVVAGALVVVAGAFVVVAGALVVVTGALVVVGGGGVVVGVGVTTGTCREGARNLLHSSTQSMGKYKRGTRRCSCSKTGADTFEVCRDPLRLAEGSKTSPKDPCPLQYTHWSEKLTRGTSTT